MLVKHTSRAYLCSSCVCANSYLDGLAGPVLIEDYHLVEKLAQFNRGKIPERVVHARGMSAKGYFEVRFATTYA